MNKKTIWTLVFAISFNYAFSQPGSHLFFTTGAGIISVYKNLNDVLKPAVGFNSSLEIVTKKGWFGQVTADLNTLQYNQQLKDENSPYLLQHSNSSLLMFGLNAGKNFRLCSQSFLSTYIGEGYLTVGEPRVTLDNITIRQKIYRQANSFTRAGARLAFPSPLKFLQILYFDGNWWASPVKVQGYRLGGYSLFIGSRMII